LVKRLFLIHFVRKKHRTMKKIVSSILFTLLCLACTEVSPVELPEESSSAASKKEVARILANLGMGKEQLCEVFDAVNSSNSNGYDEEYTLSSLFSTPGAGVGDRNGETKAASYSKPLKELFREYLGSVPMTKAGAADVEEYIRSLSESDLQIYWPYSEDWNGEDYPIVTFDPGYGAESNYGYEIARDAAGKLTVKDSVLVDENVARSRPVWVINSNDDSAFSPLEMYTTGKDGTKSDGDGRFRLVLKDFKMLRNYDSWFGGASEFFIKIGAVDGFKATSDEDLKLYTPSVTDFMLVVKRKQLGKVIPLDIFLLQDVTEQMDKVAFIVVEDDGGKTTSWKCSATVKFKSKSYGFEMEIPYKDKDDIVWRGQLPVSYFTQGEQVSGRFGDVEITFELM